MKLQSFVNQTPYLLALFFGIQIVYWHFTIDNSVPRMLVSGTIIWFFFQFGYRLIDLHKRWGFFGVTEPESHWWFGVKSVWVVHQWILGVFWWACILNIKPHQIYAFNKDDHFSFMRWEFPSYLRYSTDSKIEQFFWALVLLYVIDFLRYWAHRIGHKQFFYRTFPFSHAHHHNQFFLHPWALATSPFFHIANWAAITPAVIMWGMGLRQSALWGSVMLMFPNLNQHLGCDPFPWLTRLNHYYFYGAIPWIPLYHQYHHLPWVRRGNYGNLTALWDYVYGTLIPESIEHIETGKPPKHVQERFENPKLNEELSEKLKNRNILDYNRNYDSSIFNFRYI